jgi:hypothetical protein
VLTWALNGVGLALMIPNAQSMVADYYAADSRGKAFGMMGLTSATGAMVGALYATNIGAPRSAGRAAALGPRSLIAAAGLDALPLCAWDSLLGCTAACGR